MSNRVSIALAQHATLGIAAVVLCSCSTLPASGPSAHQVQAEPRSDIRIVDVDSTVAQRLLEMHPQKLFSEAFQGNVGASELVGPGDVLEVSVWEAPPAVLFASAIRTTTAAGDSPAAPSSVTTLPAQMISVEGTIYVPFAGEIEVTGKSLQEIESLIATKLHGKANRPQVLVRLLANNTAYVTVVGEVTNSVRMPLSPHGERLLDALAAAGGTRQPADKITVQVTRAETVQSLPLDTVIRDPLQNILLQPGDVITALYQPLSFTALGATGKSDEINFESKGISLAQALARVGGVIDSRANAEGVFIFRLEAPDGQDEIAAQPLNLHGKVPVIYRINLKDPKTFFVAQSFQMRNRDVLYVANAPSAELQKFLNLLFTAVYPVEDAWSLAR